MYRTTNVFTDAVDRSNVRFSCWITYRGKYFAKRNVEWVVPVLINEFELAEPPNLEDCPDEQTTKKPEDYQTTLLPDMSTAKSTEATRPNTSDQPIEPKPQDAQVPVVNKSDTKPDKPKNHNSSGSSKTPIFECAIRKPQSRESYQQSLERQLVKLQCDKMVLEEQAFLEKQAIAVELRDIIQLHDDLGERIKKLEMQLRS